MMNKLFISVNKQSDKPACTTNWIMFNYIIILTLFCPLARVGLVFRLVHLDIEDCSEELLRQQAYAIKNHFACSSLVLYGTRAPIIGPFRAWKPTILMP